MKIVSLTAENLKKLTAVHIEPSGNLVQITGKNGQGKTSVLDAIWWALAGASNIQAAPIREGADTAMVKLDLGDMIVTRTFRRGDAGDFTTQIKVENREGAKFGSPQKLLDDLLGRLSIDPLAFTRMAPKDQFETLRKFVPDVDFKAIDEATRADYDERRDVNRQAQAKKAQLEALVIPADAPAQLPDEAKLLEQYDKAHAHNEEIKTRTERRAKVKAEIDGIHVRLKEIDAEVDRLTKEAEGLVAKGTDLEAKLSAAPALPTPIDTVALRAQIDQARAGAELVRRRKQKSDLATELHDLETKSADITNRMETRLSNMAGRIRAAKLPVPGVGFGQESITLNGKPFNQASDAEQLRASIAIAMALQPKLKVIRVRDGSLLDADGMKLLGEMADHADCQVWIERVDGSGNVGFVLEDGHLKNQEKEKPHAHQETPKESQVPSGPQAQPGLGGAAPGAPRSPAAQTDDEPL